jgi:CO dehydrogenase nickel-insertion accessory protein CooC1
MTFEEAIEIIEEVDGEVGAIGYIINKLQETYAPKIKMTSEQKEEFMAFVDSPDDNFENFWFCLGSGDSLYKNKISEEDLMLAWLHPELIEVEE